MEITKEFAKFIAATNYEQLPTDVVTLAKERILDTVGAAIAGEHSWESKKAFLTACRKLEKGDFSVWGSRQKDFPLARAAMINATYAHAIELDDGHKNAGCHAGAVIVPTALTLGQALGKSGKEILNAVVIGYEIVYRIVAQMTPYQIQRGFHPSGNCDVFGAMAVAGKLMGLNEGQLANGLGFAGLSAAGLMEATKSGQQNKCIQVGNAAFNGIVAAYYAEENLEGTTSVLEGKTGFFNAQSQDVNYDEVVRGLGKEYHIGDTYSKMYPTCRHSQAAIEAVLDLESEEKIDWQDVESIWVGTHQVAYDLTGVIKEPHTAAQAKFSMPYGIALALHEHSVGICHLNSKYWDNPVNKELAQLVTVVVDPAVQALYPKQRGAKVRITLKNGRTVEKELYELKGSPKKPVGWTELETKFVANVSGIIEEKKLQTMIKLIHSIETVENISCLTELLSY